MTVQSSNFSKLIGSINSGIPVKLVRGPAKDLIEAATIKLDGGCVQEGFHPYGAIVAATTIAALVLGISSAVCNMLPYSIRSHVLLSSKITTGVCLFKLIGTAINSIRTEVQETPTKRACSP